MPLKKTRKEVKEELKPIPAELFERLEVLHDDFEAAGARRQVLDHLQEAFFQIDPSQNDKPTIPNAGA